MSRCLKLFLLIFLISSPFCHANAAHEEKDLAIHTYGGGELLQKVFTSISMLVYGNSKSGVGKTFNAFVRIALVIGGFCCISLALFKGKFEPLITHFFLPGIGIIQCLLIPRTTVYIADHLYQKASSTQVYPLITVEDTPYFFGKFVMLVSTLSHRFTLTLEGVAHGNNQDVYNWTGHIYAGEQLVSTKKLRIGNKVLEDNFRGFCRECVFRDIGIGLYSKDDLVHSKNLLQFLAENTSKIRTVFYRQPLNVDGNHNHPTEGEFLSCHEAMQRMNALFNRQEGNTKKILLGELGNELSFLLGQKETGQEELKNLMKQQIAIQCLKEEIPGDTNSFAAKRAAILQNENQKILGALGIHTIVALRNFFEAVIYMVFPLIVIVALLSFGVSSLIHWIQFVLWVNIWPVFYVVVHFLLYSLSNGFRLLSKDGFTIFTSEGLFDLYHTMEAIAAISMASIPFLSWIILKGGVSQMVQLASSVMAPAQGAAAIAAGEKTSGNYGFGNVNLETVSGYNAQMNKESYSGQLTYGSVGIDNASQSMTFTPGQGELFIKQGDSHLREGISRTEAFGTSLQSSLTSSETAVLDASKTVSSGITDSSNKAVGYVEALARHVGVGQNSQVQSTNSLQDAYQYLTGVASDYAHSKGISHDAAIREVFSAGLGAGIAGKIFGIKGDVQASVQDGVSHFGTDSISEKAMDSSTFQQHIQTIKNLSSGEVANFLSSEDARLHEDFVQSLNKTDTAVDQWRSAYAKQEALADLKSYSERADLSYHQNLNQRFVEFLQDRFNGDTGLISNTLDLSNTNPQKRELINEFVGDYLPKNTIAPSDGFIVSTYQKDLETMTGISQEGFEKRASMLKEESQSKMGITPGMVQQEAAELGQRIDQDRSMNKATLNAKNRLIEGNYNSRKMIAEDNTKQSLWDDATSHMAVLKTGKSIWDALFKNEMPEKNKEEH